MPIAFVSAAASGTSSSSGGTLNATVPAGNVDDLMLLFVDNNTGGAIGGASGWTLVVNKDLASDISGSVYYRWATGSEPSTYAVTAGSASNVTTQQSAIICRYSGVDKTNPIRAFASGSSSTNVTASNAQTAPAGVQATDLAVLFYGWAAWTVTNPANAFPRYPGSGGWNQRATAKQSYSGSNAYVAGAVAVDLLGATGTYPTANVTSTASNSTAVNGTWVTIALALVPAVVKGSMFPAFR